MKPIEHAELAVGMQVHYRYERTTTLQGPFTVAYIGRDHMGPLVRLQYAETAHVRVVSLADDEDYGLALFFTT